MLRRVTEGLPDGDAVTGLAVGELEGSLVGTEVHMLDKQSFPGVQSESRQHCTPVVF